MNILSLTKQRISARVLAVITIMSMILSAFPAAFFVAQAAVADTLFSDGFEAGNLSAWNIAAGQYHVVNNAAGAHSGTYRTDAVGAGNTGGVLVKYLSTEGYEDVTVTFWYKLPGNGFEAGETLTVDYSAGGGVWQNLATFGDGDETDTWTEWTMTLPSDAVNNANFGFRFQTWAENDSDIFSIDDLSITGTEIKKADICHWNGSSFELLNVSVNSLGTAHGASGVNDGDIIPAVDGYVGQNLSEDYNGATGAEVLAADCVVPDPVVDLCPNIDGDQTEVPDGYHVDDQTGDCVEDTQPPAVTYGDFCGDGYVNQAWEECDPGYLVSSVDQKFVGCSEQCQFIDEPACTDLTLARVNITGVENLEGGIGDMTNDVYLGGTPIPNSAWFLLYVDGVYESDADVSNYEDVPGLAVERQAGTVRAVMYGTNTNADEEHVDGTIEFWSWDDSVAATSVSSDNSNDFPGSNQLEGDWTDGSGVGKTNAGDDEVWIDGGDAHFWLTTTTADDGFYAAYSEPAVCEAQCEPEEHVFADSVVDADQGTEKDGSPVAGYRSNPDDALGEPDWVPGVSGFFSLGFGGWIIVSFDKYVVNVDGDDLSIHEATNGTYPLEKARVEVSQNGSEWHVLSEEARNDSTEGGDGVTLLDFDETGLDWIKYVLITDTTDSALHTNTADGYDVDAVDATYVVCDEPEPDPDMIAIHTYKVVCTDEADLPNWNSSPHSGAPTITADTAEDWVRNHGSCYLEEGWEFQWAPAGTSNPGDTLYGAAGGSWSAPFTGTTNILLADLNGARSLWMREVLQDGYIPFTFALEGNKNTDDVTAEFYCHIDGLNYDNYDRIDYPKVDGEYYCVAWNTPTEPPVTYGDYCGDGVRQGWEQCDGVDTEDGYQCTDMCTFADQCLALPLVKITLDDEAPASESFDGLLYLGSTANPIPSGTWFHFAEPGDQAVQQTAMGATGLAIERTPTDLRLAVEGGNATNHFDYVFGSIETLGIDLGAVDRGPVVGWPLENSGTYEDIFAVNNTDESVDFKLWLTTGDDSVAVGVTPGEEYGYCPDCDAEVEARVVLQDGEEILQNGDGNLLPQVILGDGSTVPFGEWFKLSEANPGPSATWIDDVKTVTDYDNPSGLEGLFVSREGNGQVKVALYGFHNPGGDVNYESLRATIEFNDAKVDSAMQIPGDYKLEDHSESDGVDSNDNFDSFAVAGDSMSVDFDFWVDTAADGITITLDEDSVATCDDDTDPENPPVDPETYLVSGHKYETGDDYIGFLSGWTITIDNGDDVLLSTTTDASGYYYFEVPAGSYQVSETMQTDWVQVQVLADGVLVDTDADIESCDITVPEVESDYTCDFYNEYVGGGEPVYGCMDPLALNYNQDATEQGEVVCTYEEERRRSSGGGSGTRIAQPVPQVLGETISFCPFLEDYMQIGWENDPWEVTKLQLFLNLFRSVFGGTENPVTGVFDQTTDANVKAFQQYFRADVLDPWFERGIVPHDRPTGFVYKTTRWKINDIVCPGWEDYPSFDGENLNSNINID